MLRGKGFPLVLKMAVYKRYVWPALLYESELWRLREDNL